jgi:hypothetical protein
MKPFRSPATFHLLPLLLAACAAPEPAPSSPPTVVTLEPPPYIDSASKADELIAYVGHLRGMSDAALNTEAVRQRRDGSDAGRVRAALALSLNGQSDEAEIIALVEPTLRRGDAPADVKSMAGFLQALAIERRRLKESAAAAGTRLRDERKAAEAHKLRADTLQQKLDALTELEKSLSDRSPPAH